MAWKGREMKIGVDFWPTMWHKKNIINTGARVNGLGTNVEVEIPIDDKKERMDVMESSAPSTGHPGTWLTFQVQKNG